MIGEGVSESVVELRAEAEELMLDACVIVRPGDPVLDRATLRMEAVDSAVYAGKCRFRSRSISGHSTTDASLVGGVEWALNQTELHLPFNTSAGARVGDIIVCTAVGALTNPDMLGTRHVLIGIPAGSWLTSRRFKVNQVV